MKRAQLCSLGYVLLVIAVSAPNIHRAQILIEWRVVSALVIKDLFVALSIWALGRRSNLAADQRIFQVTQMNIAMISFIADTALYMALH